MKHFIQYTVFRFRKVQKYIKGFCAYSCALLAFLPDPINMRQLGALF